MRQFLATLNLHHERGPIRTDEEIEAVLEDSISSEAIGDGLNCVASLRLATKDEISRHVATTQDVLAALQEIVTSLEGVAEASELDKAVRASCRKGRQLLDRIDE